MFFYKQEHTRGNRSKYAYPTVQIKNAKQGTQLFASSYI